MKAHVREWFFGYLSALGIEYVIDYAYRRYIFHATGNPREACIDQSQLDRIGSIEDAEVQVLDIVNALRGPVVNVPVVEAVQEEAKVSDASKTYRRIVLRKGLNKRELA